jgi:radical SAM superfamily enzyme YgiQ (UPF0313 family)
MKQQLVFLAVNASYAHTSLAAWLLKESADPARWDWHTVETATPDAVPAVLERVCALKPDVLAVTFYLFNRPWLNEFLARFRVLSPGTRVIGGGPEWLGDCTAFFQPVPLVDAGIRGEGELAFRQWLDIWDQPGKWNAIKGLVRMEEGCVRDSGEEADRPEPESIPSPYARECTGFEKPFILLEASRGCRGACLFCTSGRGGGVRAFPQDRVRADLRAIHAAGIREVRVLDRTFNDDDARAVELLDLFRTECPDTRFHLEIEPAAMSDGLVEAMRRFMPGRLHVEAGVQSLDEAVMRQIGRRGTPADVLAGLQRLTGVFGLEVHADLIAGLSGGTWEGVLQDLTLLTLLGMAEIQLEILKLLPGTRLEAMRQKWELMASPVPPYEVVRTATFPAEALWRVARLSRVVDGFHNQSALRPLVRKACMMIPGFWADLADVVEAEGGVREGLSLRKRFRLFKRFLADRRPELVTELVDAWYRRDDGVDEELAPARMWRGPVPDGARLIEGEAGAYDRVVMVQGPPVRYYAFQVEANGQRRLAAVYES